MKQIILGATLVLLVTACGGCASVTFKRGASGDAMAADERACRAETSDDAGYAECMRKRGSYVTGGSVGNEATAAAAKPPPATFPAPTAIPHADAPSGDGMVSPPAPPTPPAAPLPAPSASPTPMDPMEQVSVASWWKVGASPADLDKAVDACVAKLGPVHRPQPGATLVTAGMRDCLRQGGWFAVGRGPAR